MNDTRSARDFAKTMSNAEKVVFNEVQKNFFRKESAYFGSVDMNYPCGGSKIDMKQFFDSPAQCANSSAKCADSPAVDPSAGDLCQSKVCDQGGSADGSHKAMKTEKSVQIKGVGFDLLYTRDGSSSQQPSIKEINIETPCKVIMAVVLIAYVMNRYIQPADEVDSFFGAILRACCRCALWNCTPLWLANRWFAGADSRAEADSVKVESQTPTYGNLWKANVWLRKFTNAFGKSLSSSPVAVTKTAPSLGWTDKVVSLLNRGRT